MPKPEFPGNSYKERMDPERKAVPEPAPEKVVGKVVTGRVMRKKKGALDKFAETFFGQSAQSVGQYVLFDVLIPAAKETLVDMVKSGIEMLVLGEARRPGVRRGDGRDRTMVSYNGLFKSDRDRQQDRRPLSPRNRATHKFDELVYETYVEADDVLDKLLELIDMYGSASVADFYEASNVTGDWIDQKWGWTNLRSATRQRVREGYILILPEAEPLD
jgi:hypothetical protein